MLSPGAKLDGALTSPVLINYWLATCSLGWFLVGCTEAGICSLLLGDDPENLVGELTRRNPSAQVTADEKGLAPLMDKVKKIIEGADSSLSTVAEPITLDLRGTPFQKAVWEALLKIPAGTTATYGQIATAIGARRAVRAVAQACATNPVAVLIPCHRVVKSDGSLSGYRWGVGRKRTLLAGEGISLSD